MRSEIERIHDQLRRGFDGAAWHGPAVQAVLAGLTSLQAHARSMAGAHTICEVALHIAAWKDLVRRRLEGEPTAALTADEDWPPVMRTDEAAWIAARAKLVESHGRLLEAVVRLDDTRLDDPLASEPGTSETVYTTLQGLVQHDLYHAGQIVLLRKAGPV